MNTPTRSPRLLDRYREEMVVRHYAKRTVQSYVSWVRRYLRFHQLRHPREMGQEEINAFLTHLAVKEKLAATSQNQALAALLFLYRTVLGGDVGSLEGVVRAHRPRRLPVVLSEDEVRRVFVHLQGTSALVGKVLYGSGLRLKEALRLRIKDVDFDQSCIVVRNAKGHKDRITVLPESLKIPLKAHLNDVRALHQQDLATTWIPAWFKKRCMPLCRRLGSTSLQPVTRCAIRLPPTCWSGASTFARSRSCWGTAT